MTEKEQETLETEIAKIKRICRTCKEPHTRFLGQEIEARLNSNPYF